MVYDDSALVINQVNKDWSYSNDKMDTYYAEIRKLQGKFYGIEYHHVVRDQNQIADQLSKIGSSRATAPVGIFVQDLLTKDGNGDPIPDTRRVFDPLGDGDGIISLPAGI